MMEAPGSYNGKIIYALVFTVMFTLYIYEIYKLVFLFTFTIYTTLCFWQFSAKLCRK